MGGTMSRDILVSLTKLRNLRLEYQDAYIHLHFVIRGVTGQSSSRASR